MDGPGKCPLYQQQADSPPIVRHLLYPQGCKSTMRFLAPASKIFQKGFLRWMMDGDFNPGTEVENQGEGLANSPPDHSLQHSQSAISSLCSRWLLGGLLLGIEQRPISH